MKKTDTRQLLADAFMELLKKNSFESICVTDISEACEASRQTFYRYFHDKHDLSHWIALQDAGYSPADPLLRPGREMLLSLLYGMQAHRSFYAKAIRFTGQNSMLWYIVNDSRAYFSVLFEHQAGRPPNRAEVFEQHAAVFTTVFMMMEWLMRGFPDSPEEFTGRLSAFFPQSIREMLSRTEA